MVNRPQYLKENIKFYCKFPLGYDLDIDFSKFPFLLNFDFHMLNGILPLTKSRFKYIGKNSKENGKENTVIFVNPLKEEYEYFKSIGVTEFQAISIVLNLYIVEISESNVVKGFPYGVSLVPMSKDGKIDTWDIDLLKNLDLEKICQQGGRVFTEFIPFEKWNKGMGMDYSLFSQLNTNTPTDSIGFEWGLYFISPKFDKKEVVIPENRTYSKEINKKYRDYKINRYFKTFINTKPRQIWGCESPIELFLLQGMYIRKLNPEIQMSFYKSGEIFPNYYKMAEQEIFIPQNKLITASDFYFTNKKLAIFCDGSNFHNVEKDKKIDSELNKIGIKSLRFSGKRITEELETVLDEIEHELQHIV